MILSIFSWSTTFSFCKEKRGTQKKLWAINNCCSAFTHWVSQNKTHSATWPASVIWERCHYLCGLLLLLHLGQMEIRFWSVCGSSQCMFMFFHFLKLTRELIGIQSVFLQVKKMHYTYIYFSNVANFTNYHNISAEFFQWHWPGFIHQNSKLHIAAGSLISHLCPRNGFYIHLSAPKPRGLLWRHHWARQRGNVLRAGTDEISFLAMLNLGL